MFDKYPRYNMMKNPNRPKLRFLSYLLALPDVKKHPLAVGFGKNIKGDVIYADFDEFPHMLCAGTTGSGKSIFTNSIIVTLIMRNSPDDLKMVLIDAKKVEMSPSLSNCSRAKRGQSLNG